MKLKPATAGYVLVATNEARLASAFGVGRSETTSTMYFVLVQITPAFTFVVFDKVEAVLVRTRAIGHVEPKCVRLELTTPNYVLLH